jgi:hypothetical protein
VLIFTLFETVTSEVLYSKPNSNDTNNILAEMPECARKLNETNTNCGTEYNTLDHYLFVFTRKEIRRKVCCNEWKYRECLMKEVMAIPECGEEAMKIIQKTPIKPIKEVPHLCDIISDSKYICNANVIPIDDYDNTWLIIGIIVIISLWLTFLYPTSTRKLILIVALIVIIKNLFVYILDEE